ncbi:MAG: DNA-binding protein [Candidatus Hydrothermarchaeota archaeon]|jgi:programmed cell death protein 5|nr:DNA-binding protein [Candidatus Hydrothermarchaeota archaeon]|tara:strand:- start:446 stop:769 length:324 start_codon:yes stop_codon:yes gene_type:complete
MENPEELKRKKLLELQQKMHEENAKQEQQQQFELQKRSILKGVLTPEARGRLANVKLARRDYALQVENLLIQMAQTGQVKQKITDTQLKQILGKISKKKREFKIKRV